MREEPIPEERRGWLPWAMLPPIGFWLVMTVLRESPLFWRNAGGYPVELREFVLETYYPITFALFAGCGVGMYFAFRKSVTLRRLTVAGWLFVAAALGFGLAYAGANNLANLMEGRPLHAHPSHD